MNAPLKEGQLKPTVGTIVRFFEPSGHATEDTDVLSFRSTLTLDLLDFGEGKCLFWPKLVRSFR